MAGKRKYLNEPVMGMEERKEPNMLQRPKAIISWLASSGLPLAVHESTQ
jgi:hypothetical protein